MQDISILIVLTSHNELTGTGAPTGWWLEEMAVPYLLFKEKGYSITVASPDGGKAPLDPKSTESEHCNAKTDDFMKDVEAQDAVNDTIPLEMVRAEDYDALFFPGGHGPIYDLASNEAVAELVADFMLMKKPVAAVCHGPAALLGAVNDKGKSLLEGHKVTGFSNTEETAVGLNTVLPYLLEDALVEKGASYERGDDWQPHVVVSKKLITGQNPASSEPIAKELISMLDAKKKK